MKKFQLFITILILTISSTLQAQLTGTKNIPGDYPTIAAAVADLNSQGVGSGGVTFNVAAGHTETITATIVLTATGTAANPIVFQKSGAGANPLITAYTGGTGTPGSATQDGIWALIGSDYVTIDGIDLLDPNTTNPATMEYGYGLFKASVTNGCQYVTIQNCTITLNRVNNASGTLPAFEGSKGIEVVNATRTAHTTALTPTSPAGSNSFNKFYSNTIQNCNYGIAISGFAATSGVGPNPDPSTFLGDLNNDIGGTSAATGNTILNYGGGGATSPAAGIRVNNQWSINISYNTINNNDGSGVNHTTTLRGIFAQAGTSANATITHNNITLRGGGTTTLVAAIENGIGSTAAGNTVNINNNTITGDYLTATSGAFYGIYSTASAATVNINNNTVQNLSYSAVTLTGTGAVYPIWNSGAATTVNANNNTVNNITRTGTTGGTTIGVYISAGTTQNVNGNTITNMSIDGSGTASTMYGIQTATGTITVNNNNISNLQCIKTTGTSPLYGIYNIASPTNETINNNNVNNLTHNGTGTVYGIYHFTVTGTRTMSGNTVHTITGAGTTIAGINNASSSPSVFRNNVYNISSTSTGTPTVSGIIQGSLGTSGVAYIYNNFVSDIKAPYANNAAAAVRGINITTTTTSTNIYLFYNTVYLDASSSGANFGTAALFVTASATATTANLTMRNNIFVNNSTANGTGFTVAYQRSSTDLANYNNASNNNLFYAGTPSTTNLIFRDGTNNDQTLSAYKTRVAPRDANSVTENPPFVNVTTTPYDLHIDPNTPTQIESGGIRITSPIAITTDFDNDIRALETGYTGSGNAPDIGADEGEFTLADYSPPVITYTPLGNTANTTTRTLSNVVITDATGVDFTPGSRPRLYFKKSTDANTYAGNTSSDDGWKWVETNDVSSPVSFTFDYSLLQSPVQAGDVIQYFVVAQDISPNGPFVGINSGTFASTPNSVDLDASHFPITGTINSYTIVASISGSKTVGSGGDYPTLTGAGGLFADINSKVVTGDIVATIISDITEPGTNALNQMNVEGGNWTLTIQPDAATVRTISGSYDGGLIRLNGADRVTIDGRYNGEGNYLTFSNTATSGTIAAIQLISLGTGQGCENVTIRNCNISTGSNTITTSYGISVGGSTIGTTGNDNDNLSIIENVITKCWYGMYVGAGSAGVNNSLNIYGNTIGSNSSSDYVIFRGINLLGADGANIYDNIIFNLQTSGAYNIAAIDLGSDVTNSNIYRNRIYGLRSTSASGYGAYGINISSSTNNTNNTIHTNVIYDIITANYSTTSTTWNAFGIRITGGTNHKIYYNSVNLFGNVTSGSSAGMSAAFLVTSASVTGLDIRNNIFVNSTNFAVAGSKSYAIYVPSDMTFGTIDRNDYFGSGTYGILGYFGADITSLSAWQTATGQDGNSISANPQFNSNTNLQPQLGSPVLGAGTPISGITTDFLGVTRNATNPSMGAYEEGTDISGPTITYTPLSNTNSTANRQLSNVIITDVSGVDFGSNKPRIYYKKSTDANVFGGNTSSDNGWKWTETSSSSSPAEFLIDYSIIYGGSVSVGDIIQYFVVAQDLFTTPNVGSNPSAGFAGTSVSNITSAPTTPNSYRIAQAISGSYNVGTDETYTNLTGATGFFKFVNDNVVTGDVTVNITSDLTEDGTHGLNQWAEEGGSGFTITIQPSAATMRNISGNVSTALIRLNGADRVTIDGRFNGLGNYLTFSNTNTTANHMAIQLISLGTGQGCENVTIRNSIIQTGSNSVNSIGIHAGGTTFGSNGADHDNLSIIDNVINVASYGILVFGSDSTSSGGADNLTITGNSVTCSTSVQSIGIRVRNALNANISANELDIQQSSSNAPVGISLETGVNNTTVSRNRIKRVAYTGTLGYGGRGIVVGTGLTSSNVTLVNNLIYGVTGDNWSSFGNSSSIGIAIGVDGSTSTLTTTTGGVNIYYNSVNLYGTYNRATACITTALYVGSNASNLDIRNNVFANSLDNTGTASTSYAIYSAAGASAYTQINYNDYYAPAPEGVLGFLTSNRTTLSDWQTATGKDAYSYSGDPAFTANDNLLPDNTNTNCWNLNGKGIPISGISTDYAGNSRSTSVASGPTDIGAYEFTPSVNPPSASPSAPPSPSSTTTYSVAGNTIASITWGGSGTVPTSVDVQYYSGTPAPAPNLGSKPRINAYWDITQTGGSGFSYDITLTYDEAHLGNINENNLIPAKSDDGGNTWTPFTVEGTNPGEFQRNTTANTITIYGLTSFSMFTLGDNNDPLPVQLTSFVATTKGRDVILNWTTATEINTAGFEIERKLVSQEKAQAKWENVGFVRGNGNSNRPIEYTFTDVKLNTGKYAYRLKMIDNDGSFAYSDEVQVEIGKPDVTKIEQNYPNAFNPATKIEYQLANPSKVVIEVYNITGEKITELVNSEQVEGYYSLVFDASKYGLASGIYFYRMIAMDRVTGKNVVQTKKMLYLK